MALALSLSAPGGGIAQTDLVDALDLLRGGRGDGGLNIREDMAEYTRLYGELKSIDLTVHILVDSSLRASERYELLSVAKWYG